MKAKTKLLIFPIFLGLIIGLFSINQVDAVSYYNWIQNPSFATYTNYVEDGGFESGSFDSGVIYGNWSDSDSTGEFYNLLEVNIYSGVYSMHLYYEGNHVAAHYNLYGDYNETLGGDIVEFSFYGFSSDAFRVEVGYSDGTSDNNSSISFGDWSKIDVTSLINDSKYMINFTLMNMEGSGSCFIDDVVLLVDDGEGQDGISDSSEPWYHGTTPPLVAPNIYGYIGINTTFGRIDSSSGYIGYLDSLGYIIQSINVLDTEYLHFVNLYYYVKDSTDLSIKIVIVYSDGSQDYKELDLTVNSTWTELNFGKSWIDSNKYITSFIITLGSITDENNLVYIDDVGLWASVPLGFSRFDYTLSPSPTVKTNTFFGGYTNQQYVLYGYLYNDTGDLSQNGTVLITDAFGDTNTTLVNGQFSYTINARTYTTDTTEYFTFKINTEDDEIFIFQIYAIWDYTPSGTDVSDVDSDLILNFFIYGIFFLAIPLTVSFYVGGIDNPSLGISAFIGAVTLMGAIGLSIRLIDIWFMIAIIILDILLILAMLRGRI